MKKTISVCLFLIMTLVLLTGCSPATSAATSAPTAVPAAAATVVPPAAATVVPAAAKQLIGFSMANTDEYRTSWLSAFNILLGDKYELKTTNADKDFAKQISDIDSLLALKPALLIIQPASDDAIVPALESANAKNIPVILIDSNPKTDKYTTVITDDQTEPGKLQAEYVNAWLDKDPTRVANVGYVVGDYKYLQAMPREPGFFDNCPRCKKIVEQQALFDTSQAMALTEDWLQTYPQINVYACMNDDMAIGVIQALKAANKNLDNILVLGVDGTVAGLQYLKTGELDFTVAQDVNIATKVTFDTMVKILNGEKVDKLIHPHSFKALTPDSVK